MVLHYSFLSHHVPESRLHKHRRQGTQDIGHEAASVEEGTGLPSGSGYVQTIQTYSSVNP